MGSSGGSTGKCFRKTLQTQKHQWVWNEQWYLLTRCLNISKLQLYQLQNGILLRVSVRICMPTSKALNMMPTQGEAQKYSCLYKYRDHSYTRKEYCGWVTERLILLWTASSLGEILAQWAGPFLNRLAQTFSILAASGQELPDHDDNQICTHSFPNHCWKRSFTFPNNIFLEGPSKLRHNSTILRRMPSCLWEWYVRMRYLRPSCGRIGKKCSVQSESFLDESQYWNPQAHYSGLKSKVELCLCKYPRQKGIVPWSRFLSQAVYVVDIQGRHINWDLSSTLPEQGPHSFICL